MTVTLRKVGGSVVMAVPRKILRLVNLGPGSRMDLSVESGKVVATPTRRPRYTLEELLARTPGKFLVPKRSDPWLRSGPVGKEVL